MKIGLLFSGQGAQSVGMAKTLYDNFDAVKALFKRADEAVGFPLSKYCFEGPMSELTKTGVCQPALYLHGMAVVEVLREKGALEEPITALGLSLGELTAHAFAETFDFETGLRIVAKRGRLMQEACEATKGSMASFIGGSVEAVAAYCKEFDVDISNLNCPGQTVISGEADKVKAAVEAAQSRKEFKMVIPLKVAGAYHSRLMKPAAEKFSDYLKGVEFKSPRITVFTNVTGESISDPQSIKDALVKQVTSTVRWEDCMRKAAELGTEQFYECGPGGVLAGLGKRIDKTLKIKSLAELQDF